MAPEKLKTEELTLIRS